MQSDLSFVYVIYIATTPENLWLALTNGEFTRQYWYGRRIQSEWRVGAPLTLRVDGTLDLSGTVLECDPPYRLAFTFLPESNEEFRAEGTSRVVLDLEQQGSVVKFTLTHDQFLQDGQVFRAIQVGWPLILSSLKSLLETGRALAITAQPPEADPTGGTLRAAG